MDDDGVVRRWAVGARRRIDARLGGSQERELVVVLAATLGLASADQAAIGASATQLRDALHLTNTDLGVVAAMAGIVGAVATLPMGRLVDRVNRTRLLMWAVATWAVAMALCAVATSFAFLLVVQAGLGAVVAVAWPATASLVGDAFPASDRGRIWGYVLTGELVGAGFGFTVAGALAAVSWRIAFLSLVVPAVVLAVVMRHVAEPARRTDADGSVVAPAEMSEAQTRSAAEARPIDELVLHEDPSGWSMRRAIGYVLAVRTNVMLIVAGAGAYFFFAGVRAFGVEFVKGEYGIGQATATSLAPILGAFAVVGVLASGRTSDGLIRRDHTSARLYVGLVAMAAATVVFVPAILTTSVLWGVLFLGVAAMFLGAVNPPLDAARLDIMHPSLWGRAEAVRTVCRQPAEALAPLLFGFLADRIAGGGQEGLRTTFLVMLVPLALAVLTLWLARGRFTRDVATAAASIEATSGGGGEPADSDRNPKDATGVGSVVR